MSESLLKQFEMTRGFFLRGIGSITEETASVQPDGFNNTIHWHIGHVLTVTEQFLFGYPHKSNNLPESYIELFKSGSKPAEWKGDVPSVEELIGNLKDQVVRIKDIPAERLQETLEKPFLGFESVGELANMALFHEAHHLGQIHTMKRIITNENVKA